MDLDEVKKAADQALKPSTEMVRSLDKKVALVTGAMNRVPKRGWNDFHKYHYATESDITEALGGALAAVNLSFLPYPDLSKLKIDDLGMKTAKNDIIWAYYIEVEMELTDGDSGEKRRSRWPGYAFDSSDKGIYKAMTGATKNAEIKTFKIATGDATMDPEHPHEGEGVGKKAPRGAQSAKPPVDDVKCTHADCKWTGPEVIRNKHLTGFHKDEIAEEVIAPAQITAFKKIVEHKALSVTELEAYVRDASGGRTSIIETLTANEGVALLKALQPPRTR